MTSCSIDNLLPFLLKHIEGSPETRFFERDITRISPAGFSSLRKQKYLVFDQYDFEDESYFDKQGNERFVRRVNGRWVATSTEDPEISPIYLEAEDLNRYSFRVQPFLEEIKARNALPKNIDRITPRVYFIGEKAVLHDNVSVFVAFLGDDEQAEAELLGLRAKIVKVDKVLVLCPMHVITSQDLLGRLARQQVTCLTFQEAFNGKDYVIDFSKVRFEQVGGQVAPKLTAKQTVDYTKYRYKCYDRLHIPGTSPMKRSNDLSVNDHSIKMPDAPFKLLIELVVELNKGKGGWLAINTEEGNYQIFDRLRNPIEGSLLEKDAKKFIENDGSKRYRISTHPDFVTYDKDILRKHTDPEVRELAKNCPRMGAEGKGNRIKKY